MSDVQDRIATIAERHARNYEEILPGTQQQPAGYRRERIDQRREDFAWMLQALIGLSGLLAAAEHSALLSNMPASPEKDALLRAIYPVRTINAEP